jgi:hypothetical protein
VLKAAAAVAASNLAVFIAITSLPAFKAAHHHWIFPALASALILQWAGSFALPSKEGGLARQGLISLLAFLLVMGIVRHATILACFDRCSFKLGLAALMAAPIFWLHARLSPGKFWDALRSSVAALGALLWAAFLALKGLGAAAWAQNLALAIVTLALWLGRDRPVFLVGALGLAAGLAARTPASEGARIGLGILAGVAFPLAAARPLAAWLERRARVPRPPAGPLRLALAALVAGGLAFSVIGPTFLMTDPAKRRALLLAKAPEPAEQDPKKLSPLAARLRAHVVFLSRTVGERNAYQWDARNKARDYVVRNLAQAGYKPAVLPYSSVSMAAVKNGTEFHNVEAALLRAPADGAPAWIVGAHYDSAAGTPGADDNASGTAVLLELARLMRERKTAREIRFVAFGTEEPPSFGTRNMGSAHYARRLKDHGARVHGMISLEMLGYFNSRPGSQLYPPFLHLIHPDRGDFAGAVSDWRSRKLLGAFAASWRESSSLPLVASVLPGPFSGLALSDQLNFWDEGFAAIMISDTAFYRNPHYHQDSDRPETLDYEKMAEVARALASALERN